MPRFYLHIRDGAHLIEDLDGCDYPDLAAAHEDAVAGARQILANQVMKGEVIDGQAFEITDEGGVVVDRLPLKAVLNLN